MAPSSFQLLLLYSAAFIALVIWKRAPLLALFVTVGRPGAYFTVTALIALLICQAFPPGREAYPFAAWDMYTTPTPLARTSAIEVIRVSGTSEQLPMARILRGPDPRPMMRHLYRYGSRWEREDPALAALVRGEFEAYLEALIQLDSLRNPSDPIAYTELRECLVELDEPWAVRCDRLLDSWTYGAPDGP
jgi:hypothetical protein